MAAKVIQDEHMKDEAALRKDKRALKVELKELELSHEEIVKNLQIEHDKLVTKLREDYERTAKVPTYPTPPHHTLHTSCVQLNVVCRGVCWSFLIDGMRAGVD